MAREKKQEWRVAKPANLAHKNLHIQRKTEDLEDARLTAFVGEYIRNGGNATEAAIAAFNVEPAIAVKMSAQYLQRAKALGVVRTIAEKHVDLDELVKIILTKARTSDKIEYVDRLIRMLGFDAEMLPTKTGPTAPGIVNIIQTQKTLQSEFGFVEGQVVEEKDGK